MGSNDKPPDDTPENRGEVSLREVRATDLPIFLEHQLDPLAYRMAAFSPRDETVAKKTILFDGHVAGNIVAFGRAGKREVGYWIGREYWGRGIATDALARFLRLVSERPLYAIVAKHNRASIRVLEKSNFSIEGTSRGVHDANGDAVDELVMKLGQDDQGSVAND